jgi:hypothetical protein
MHALHPLAEFEPGPEDPWDRAKAAHLAARTGFGASPDEIEELLALGPAAGADARVDFPDSEPELEQQMRELGAPLYEYPPVGEPGEPQVGDARAWWTCRMCCARHPLQEKLTLFWHHHFACQTNDDLPLVQMLEQNRLFRRCAAGDFRELLAAVARDPAMLTFLDGRINVRERPNENWARELMELFTLGIDRYSQRDVVEIARVFTGWGTRGGRKAVFEFHPERHDPGEKQVLGRTIAGRAGAEGVREGEEVLALLLEQPCAAAFLGRKLLRWFLEDEPAPELCEAAGEFLRAHDWSVREFLRRLFRSRAFYASHRRAQLFKTPVGFVVSALRGLRVQNPQLLVLGERMRELGMELFHPPSVAGWDLGPAWIHAGSVLLRAQFAARLAGLPHSQRAIAGAPALDLEQLARGVGLGAGLVRSIAERLVGRALPEERVAELAAVLEARGGADRHTRTRTAIELVLGAPEFALE